MARNGFSEVHPVAIVQAKGHSYCRPRQTSEEFTIIVVCLYWLLVT